MKPKKSGKAAVRTAAVIDIGSRVVKMRVAQLRHGEVQTLDQLRYFLPLGHEVFHTGSISFATTRELSRILRGFSETLQGYGITQPMVVATTALREAKNRSYVEDQLHVLGGIDVKVLEDDEEKTLIYYSMLGALKKIEKAAKEVSLLTYIGTGSIGVALYDGAHIVYSQHLPIGSVKLHDVFSGIQDNPEQFHQVIEEYLANMLSPLLSFLRDFPVKNLVLCGSEDSIIARLCGAQEENGCYWIEAERMQNLYRTICSMVPEAIGERYGIHEDEAAAVYSALAIYCCLQPCASEKTVISPQVELWDELLREMLLPKAKEAYDAHLCDSAVCCAATIARRFACDPKHWEMVSRIALQIFDKTRPIHGLPDRVRLLLQLSAILHDCGRFVDGSERFRSIFYLIRNFDLYGLTKEEINLVAVISGYNELTKPDFSEIKFARTTPAEKLVISKSVAIFRLANALDRSGKQKIGDLKIKLDKEKLIITGSGNDNMQLEKWAFEQCAGFFKEVFGIDPVFHVKLLML
ncbi:MAG: phosphatase [Clostridia bacterium]|nr:phosphatase [Clostridia bacterium]MDY5558973.1 phosphatase [Candidatus Heritagella sp.]